MRNKNLYVQLDFEDPISISSGTEYEILVFDIKDNSEIFVSEKNELPKENSKTLRKKIGK